MGTLARMPPGGGAPREILENVVSADWTPDAQALAAIQVTAGEYQILFPPVIRSYSSFSQAADENAVSRIYIGIHFRKSVERGVHHGRQIAAHAVHQFMCR